MNSQDMQVIGFCWFFYFVYGGFQVVYEIMEDCCVFFYVFDWMEEWFCFFEVIILSGICVQIDLNFEFLIVIGECLLVFYFVCFKVFIEDVFQVCIIVCLFECYCFVMQWIINENLDMFELFLIQFCYDDDDVVVVNFVEKLCEVVDDCVVLIVKYLFVVIDFNCGFLG